MSLGILELSMMVLRNKELLCRGFMKVLLDFDSGGHGAILKDRPLFVKAIGLSPWSKGKLIDKWVQPCKDDLNFEVRYDLSLEVAEFLVGSVLLGARLWWCQ
ncbi:hypothetical protein U1Q18_008638 [Sarracenia purpurea var. burkii]